MSLDELELSVRTYNCLRRYGIETAEQLKVMTDDDLRRVRNLSVKCMDEAKRAVYCLDCKRSIYGEYRSCDADIENNGKYAMADMPCHCKVV
jgi:DNA-directed RNA polymerase alpha subunit